jgi:hypothetical protein
LAHQDVIIERSRRGELVGFPAQYQPSRLIVPKDASNVTLRIGGREIELPDCISEFFHRIPPSHVALSASWYHDPKILPYYLSIDLQEKLGKEGYFDGWSLLFNLETIELISLKRVWQTDHGWGQQSVQIEPAQICTPDEMAQLAAWPAVRKRGDR